MRKGQPNSAAARAFGEPAPPWYKGTPSGTPQGIAVVVGMASTSLAGVMASEAHGVLRVVVWAIVAVGPPGLLASFYRERLRRRDEALLPTEDYDLPAWLPRALRPSEDG